MRGFPLDIWNLLADECKVRDLFALAMTCRVFYERVRYNSAFWKGVINREYSHDRWNDLNISTLAWIRIAHQPCIPLELTTQYLWHRFHLPQTSPHKLQMYAIVESPTIQPVTLHTISDDFKIRHRHEALFMFSQRNGKEFFMHSMNVDIKIWLIDRRVSGQRVRIYKSYTNQRVTRKSRNIVSCNRMEMGFKFSDFNILF